MEEREFFAGENVYVSLTRFVVFGKTYAMSGVTSVKASEVPPSRGGPLFLGLAGLMCFTGDGVSWTGLGIVLLGLAAWVWIMQRPEYFILLSTASGEVQALKSQDRQYISEVVQALNDCIVARG